MEITARVRQSYHPRQSIEQAKTARHAVLDVPMTGRLTRQAGDALCRPAIDFYELTPGIVAGPATCRRCLELAARYGVRVLGEEAVEQFATDRAPITAASRDGGVTVPGVLADFRDGSWGAEEEIAAARAWVKRAGSSPANLVHHFDSTEGAYNQTQCRADIRDGDVLVIEKESVVGFLRGAWPAAVTAAHGELHRIEGDPRTLDDGRYAVSVAAAQQIACEHGFPLAWHRQHAAEAQSALERSHRAAERVRTNPDPTDPEWRAALAELGAALDQWRAADPIACEAMDAVDIVTAAEVADGTCRGEWIGLASAEDTQCEEGTARRVGEGVIVSHTGTAEGSTPTHAAHPDVIAAREALRPLKPATLADRHDISEPDDDVADVRGFVIDPREDGRVALYWLEGGRHVRHDDPLHGRSLDILAEKMRQAGWHTERMLRSSRCVFAHRPAE